MAITAPGLSESSHFEDTAVKTKGFVLIIVLLTVGLGCNSSAERGNVANGHVTGTSSISEKRSVRNAAGELKSSQESETDLIEAIRRLQAKESGLQALRDARLENADALISCLHSIDSAGDVTIQNIINAHTYGYKKSAAIFDGGVVTHVCHVFSQGDLHRTEIPLDLAIQGRGFFEIRMPDDDVAYTRHGHFSRNPAGRITTTSGYELLGVPALPSDGSVLKISENGTVDIIRPNGVVDNRSEIHLALFPHPEALQLDGNVLFKSTEASGSPIITNPDMHGAGVLCQGFLEQSNVDLREELNTLCTLQAWKNDLRRAVRAICEYDSQ